MPGPEVRTAALLPLAKGPGYRSERIEAQPANALFDAHRDDPERQATLGRLTPIEYEAIMPQTATKAA
ncbi:MAG: hypothetical protein JWM76_2760 [Pseudonocardiales bacterium]|nr:hypothetical protein [Pseudonocardiales bacterium]